MFFIFLKMKPLSYYQNTSVAIPRKTDYMTIYYYRKGVMIGIKTQFGDEFIPPKNCVEEQILDEISYNAHVKLYREEVVRLQNEFRKDLIAKYNMSNHPKSDKLFNMAWDFGGSLGYDAVEDYFSNLINLFQEDTSNVTAFKN